MKKIRFDILCVALLIIILCASITGFSIERNHARRILFGGQNANGVTTTTEGPSFGQSFSKWLDGFLSGDSNTGTQSDSFSTLALLKTMLSSSSSSSSDKNSKIDKLFQILSNIAGDDNNQLSSSSTKLNRLLGFFNNQGSSSNNLQLAMKLLNLAQGNGGLSSLSISDMKSLITFVGK